MDKSKKYIEMCEQAEEIQKLTNGFQVGDFIWLGKKYIYQAFVCDKTIFIKGEEIWLPRQDQLQEMVIKEQGWKLHPRDIKTLLHNICLSIENGLPPFNKAGLYSMEQLWLAFVMKMEYKKTWNGRGWIYESKKTTN